MDIAEHVAANLEVPTPAAQKAAGVVLLALRLAVPPDVFERIRASHPNAERWMGRAVMSAGRPGEIRSPTAPEGLRAMLVAAGIPAHDVARLARIVTEHLRPVIGRDAIERCVVTTPILKAGA